MDQVLQSLDAALTQLPAVALLALAIRGELRRLTEAVEAIGAAVRLHEERLDRLDALATRDGAAA